MTMLLEHGADISAKDNDGMVVVSNHYLNIIYMYLSIYPSPGLSLGAH